MTDSQPINVVNALLSAIKPQEDIERSVEEAKRTFFTARSNRQISFDKNVREELIFFMKVHRLKRADVEHILSCAYQAHEEVAIAAIQLTPTFGTPKGYTATVQYDKAAQ
jgi:hypothetical protein